MLSSQRHWTNRRIGIAAPERSGEIPVAFGAEISEEVFRKIHTELALEHFKWDSQVGDTSTLFRQPLLIRREDWLQLRGLAEELAAELMKAEQELFERPELHSILGLPRPLRIVLNEARGNRMTARAVRTLRFDFHYTPDGWRISEVNSDVPGGYTEASFSALTR